MSTDIHIKQCALIISLRCNLKCKLCLVYAPYYRHPRDYTLEELSTSVDGYFGIIDFCGTINIQGGEPLLHPQLPEILLKVLQYRNKIGKILLTTNGTLVPSEELLHVLSQYREMIQVNISDYGPQLSKRVPEVIALLEREKIPYHIICYHGDHIHYGGWLDFTDHSLKYEKEEDLIENARNCGYRKGGNIAIRGSELYFCYRVARRIELGIIKKDYDSCLDMSDPCSLEEKRAHLLHMLSAPYTPACAYCVGKIETAKHYPPAEQLSRQELEKYWESTNLGTE